MGEGRRWCVRKSAGEVRESKRCKGVEAMERWRWDEEGCEEEERARPSCRKSVGVAQARVGRDEDVGKIPRREKESTGRCRQPAGTCSKLTIDQPAVVPKRYSREERCRRSKQQEELRQGPGRQLVDHSRVTHRSSPAPCSWWLWPCPDAPAWSCAPAPRTTCSKASLAMYTAANTRKTDCEKHSSDVTRDVLVISGCPY